MKARIYIVNGKPVINTEERPESKQFISMLYSQFSGELTYDKALKEWEENCVEVENVEQGSLDDRDWFIRINNGRYETSHLVTPGQLVEVEERIITKIY